MDKAKFMDILQGIVVGFEDTEFKSQFAAAKAAGDEDEKGEEDADSADDEAGDKPAGEGRRPARRGRSRSNKKTD